LNFEVLDTTGQRCSFGDGDVQVRLWLSEGALRWRARPRGALCETSGFAENFDALTGAGLRDRAYTWTASVYLLLARHHVANT
jgi:hypothetical protein